MESIDYKKEYDDLQEKYSALRARDDALAKLGMSFEMVDPNRLIHFSQNNKRHGQRDLEALHASVEIAGFKDVILVEPDYTIIAGHGRSIEAQTRGMDLVPVMICDLDKDKARAYRIAHNQTSRLSKYNDANITKELSDLKLSGMDLQPLQPLKLEKWMKSLDAPVFDLETFQPKELKDLTKDDIPDCAWPTNNVWEVPVLNLKRQADALDLPAVQWGDISHKTEFTGTYFFYEPDKKFADSLWKDPTGPLASGCVNCVELNYSAYDEMSPAYVMGEIYKKRWLSRYWQEMGRRIFVDLNVNEKFFKAPDGGDLALLGVPDHWRAYFTRGYANAPEKNIPQFELACEKAGTDDLLFVVYGGGSDLKTLCNKRGWLWVQDRRAMNREEWTKLFNEQNQAKKT